MHGTGNDFIIIDDRLEKFKGEENALSIKLCHRRFQLLTVNNSIILICTPTGSGKSMNLYSF